MVEAIKTDVPAQFKKGGQLKTGISRRGENFRYHPEWGGVFNNDPFTVATMMRRKEELRVIIPEGFEGMNPAFKTVTIKDPFNKKNVELVVDVVAPHPTNPDVEYSLVYDALIPPAIAKFFSKQTELNDNLNAPDVKLRLKSTLGSKEGGEVIVIFDPEQGDADGKVTLRQMQDSLSRLVNFGYSEIAEQGTDTGTLEAPQRELGKNFAKVLAAVMDSGPGTGLSGTKPEYSAARVAAVAEIITSLDRFFRIATIKQDLQERGALERSVVDGELVITIKEDAVDSLFEYVGLPDKPIKKRFERGAPLPFETDEQKKAVFLLENGYIGSGEKAAPVRRTGRSGKVVEGWERITIKHFFEKELNHRSQKTSENKEPEKSSKDAEFPYIFHLIRGSADRNKKRLEVFEDNNRARSVGTVSLEAAQSIADKAAAEAGAGHALGTSTRAESYAAMRGETKEAPDPLGVFGALDNSNEIDRGLYAEELSKEMATISPRLAGVEGDESFKVNIEAVILAMVGVTGTKKTEQAFSGLSNRAKAEIVIRAGLHSSDQAKRDRLAAALTKSNVDNLLPPWFIQFMRTVDTEFESGIRHSAAELGVHIKAFAKSRQRSAPSIISSKEVEFYRQENQETVERLGLVSGDASSVIGALQVIADTSTDPDNRLVAQLLLTNEELIRDTGFVIYDIEDGRAGFYDPVSPTIAVNLSGYYGNGVESVLLHEYLHATTVGLLAKPEAELSNVQRAAKRKLVSLFEEIQSYRNDAPESLEEFHHATKSLEEFIATYFSSNSFQNTLKILSVTQDKPSLFRRVLDRILDFLSSVGPQPFRRLLRKNTRQGVPQSVRESH